MTVAEFAQHIAMLRARYGFSVVSWGRTFAHNQKVGGLEDSFHRLDLAVDGEPDGPMDYKGLAKDAKRVGLQVIRYKTYFHLEPVG